MCIYGIKLICNISYFRQLVLKIEISNVYTNLLAVYPRLNYFLNVASKNNKSNLQVFNIKFSSRN